MDSEIRLSIAAVRDNNSTCTITSRMLEEFCTIVSGANHSACIVHTSITPVDYNGFTNQARCNGTKAHHDILLQQKTATSTVLRG